METDIVTSVIRNRCSKTGQLHGKTQDTIFVVSCDILRSSMTVQMYGCIHQILECSINIRWCKLLMNNSLNNNSISITSIHLNSVSTVSRMLHYMVIIKTVQQDALHLSIFKQVKLFYPRHMINSYVLY